MSNNSNGGGREKTERECHCNPDHQPSCRIPKDAEKVMKVIQVRSKVKNDPYLPLLAWSWWRWTPPSPLPLLHTASTHPHPQHSTT